MNNKNSNLVSDNTNASVLLLLSLRMVGRHFDRQRVNASSNGFFFCDVRFAFAGGDASLPFFSSSFIPPSFAVFIHNNDSVCAREDCLLGVSKTSCSLHCFHLTSSPPSPKKIPPGRIVASHGLFGHRFESSRTFFFFSSSFFLTSDRMAAVANMYKQWRDATPTVTFPFTYKDKNEGVISQSWKDIRLKLNHDATKTSLAFCTAHIAPSALQAHIVNEVIRREDAVRATHPASVLRASRLAQSHHHGEEEEEAHAADGWQEECRHDGRSTTSLSRRRCLSPLSTEEKDALYAGEGGGRGRLHYLKLRRQRPLQERFAFRMTTQQVYGWELQQQQQRTSPTPAVAGTSGLISSTSHPPQPHSLTPLPGSTTTTPSLVTSSTADIYAVPSSPKSSFQKGVNPMGKADHRRKSALKEWVRPSGIFSRAD